MNKNSPRISRGCNKQVFSDINFDITFAIACKHFYCLCLGILQYWQWGLNLILYHGIANPYNYTLDDVHL